MIERLENGPRFWRVLTHHGTAYLAGMTADDLSGDVVQQTRDTLAKIDRYLGMAGTNKSKLLTAVI
jgi:enamine deaminase RidA (YjgF/YER057c/UK114 family)